MWLQQFANRFNRKSHTSLCYVHGLVHGTMNQSWNKTPMKITTVAKTSGFFPGLPLCSLGIMKDAWDRLRQCISPSTSMPHSSNNTLPILNQAFQFVCGGLAQVSPSSPMLPSGQMCSLADPKAITFAIMQQQHRAEVYSSLVLVCVCFNFLVQDIFCLMSVSQTVAPGSLVSDDVLPVQDGGEERRV